MGCSLSCGPFLGGISLSDLPYPSTRVSWQRVNFTRRRSQVTRNNRLGIGILSLRSGRIPSRGRANFKPPILFRGGRQRFYNFYKSVMTPHPGHFENSGSSITKPVLHGLQRFGKLRTGCRLLNLRKAPRRLYDPNETADRKLVARVLRLLRNVRTKLSANNIQSKYRLQLDVEQLALCAFGIRFARKYQKISGAQSASSREYRFERGLLRTLENARKRAKRAALKQAGPDPYREAASHWRLFESAVDREIFPTLPAYLDFRDGSRRLCIRIVGTLVHSVSLRFQAEGRELPPAKEIRRLTRSLLRYVRRGRVPLGIPDLLKNIEFAATYHFNFVSSRCSND